ncbi:MAG: [protein-PII] uridylyltransferase [Caulobacteraceae bacterium]
MDFGPPTSPPPGAALLEAVEAAVRGSSDVQREAVLGILRGHLAAAQDEARAKLEAGASGLATARALAAAVDDIVAALFAFTARHAVAAANPTEGERLSVLAVGGYGRGVLAPFSDVDLLFLRPAKATAHVERVIEFMLYALWDLGLKVGQASRTIDECLRLAEADATIRTALVDARLIAGDRKLAQDLFRRFRKAAQPRAARTAFVTAKLEERDRRHAKAGASRYLVEPNIKEGKGGIRDLDTLYWIADFLHGRKPGAGLERLGSLDPRDMAALKRAMDLLWTVRCHLHFVADRAEERLTFDLQPEIARRMGVMDRTGEPGVERFMRRYFNAAREVGGLTRTYCAELEAKHAKVRPQGLSRFWPAARAKKKLDVPGFHETGGRLAIDSMRTFRKTPANLIRLFHLADERNLDLHPAAVAAVRRALPMVTPRLRRDPEAVSLFLDLLARGSSPYRTLSLMAETGLLGRFIPEFNHTVGQMQFNMYHAYTVDEHTLRAIGIIADIAAGRLADDHPMATSIYPLITDKQALYLAMLLHDTGKGGDQDQETAGARSARAACKRMGLTPERTDLVAWLVGHHLLMSDTAQKRDISDPRTVETFAAEVETPERLRMLLVLTAADIRAVGPGVWNGWKGQLLRELYSATEALFRGHGPARPDPGDAEGADAARDGVEARFDMVRNATEISVRTADRRGLFADLATVFAMAGAQVIAARLRTSPSGHVSDVFYVQDAAGEPFGQTNRARLKSLRASLGEASKGLAAKPGLHRAAELPRAAAFAIAPAVSWDNDASSTSTVIEASGRDRPGLLAELARAISDDGYSVQSAHIDNYGARAVDAFYIQTAQGERLSKPQAAALKARLLDVLKEETAADSPRTAASSRR